MTIGNRVKELRKKNGLTQSELGEKLGISLNALSNLELNKTDASTDVIIRLSDLFAVSADYLLKGVESERTITENEQEVIEIMREDKAFKKAVIEAASFKKKAISYLGSYAAANQNAALS